MTDNNVTSRLVRATLSGNIPLIILMLSVFLGVMALMFTAREEEPQIVVPMVDVVVSADVVSAQQMERQVTTPLEKLLAQIPGVEHVYSVADSNQTVVTLRFYVGENRETSLLNTYNKLHANLDKIPSVVSNWLVKPVEVDDVPIVVLGLWSDAPEKSDDFHLRRLAEEISTVLQSIKDTGSVNLVGGRARVVNVNLDLEQMAARKISVVDIINAIQSSNTLQHHGNFSLSNNAISFDSGAYIPDGESLANTVVSAVDGSAVLLKEVAVIVDGPEIPSNYSWLDFGDHSNSDQRENGENAKEQLLKTTLLNAARKTDDNPLVTISIAKQRGSNAVEVATAIHEKMAQLEKSLFPPEVHLEVLRDYGETANEKVNNLTSSLAFAVFTVVVFIGLFLGWRPALVVGLAVPICYGFTLALDLAFGYTINRVTLFALILSLGLLVDDPITGVDNIERFLNRGKDNLTNNIVGAINEIRVPLLMSTITIVLAFVPLAFITGMMGPYMAPMAFNVPMSVIISTGVAFIVTPWLASKLLKVTPGDENHSVEVTSSGLYLFYARLLQPILDNRTTAKRTLWVVLLLFILAALLPVLRLVPLKLLPFDNKNELQVVIDMPESSTLESTLATAKKVSALVQQLPEVNAVAGYVGIASPIDFNGLVRHYYQRQQPYQGDLRVTLIDKSAREHQSHGMVLRLREMLLPLNANGISIKVVEVPPGPPVMSTLVGEIYGDSFTPYEKLQRGADSVMQRLAREPFVVEIDASVAAEQARLTFIPDKTKAALSGVSTADINQVIAIVEQGQTVSYLHLGDEAAPLPINLRVPLRERSLLHDFNRLVIKGHDGSVLSSTPLGIDLAPQPLVALGELGAFSDSVKDQQIHHKDLKPVVYVLADISGRTPAEIIADMSADMNADMSANKNAERRSGSNGAENHWQQRTFLTPGGGDSWTLPQNLHLIWGGEGEWQITVRVFRDMGLAFLFALVGIYLVLRIQTKSVALSLIIMSAIPLTIIGIMPGFLLLNQFGEREIAQAPEPVLFTATAMIGMIALAGIVVRNSLILVEFITQARAQGMALKEALLQAGAVRMRPVLLTAGTTLLGNLIITLDPVFSGLAIAIIFGIIASTLFTLLVVPIVYLLVFENAQQSTQR